MPPSSWILTPHTSWSRRRWCRTTNWALGTGPPPPPPPSSTCPSWRSMPNSFPTTMCMSRRWRRRRLAALAASPLVLPEGWGHREHPRGLPERSDTDVLFSSIIQFLTWPIFTLCVFWMQVVPWFVRKSQVLFGMADNLLDMSIFIEMLSNCVSRYIRSLDVVMYDLKCPWTVNQWIHLKYANDCVSLNTKLSQCLWSCWCSSLYVFLVE